MLPALHTQRHRHTQTHYKHKTKQKKETQTSHKCCASDTCMPEFKHTNVFRFFFWGKRLYLFVFVRSFNLHFCIVIPAKTSAENRYLKVKSDQDIIVKLDNGHHPAYDTMPIKIHIPYINKQKRHKLLQFVKLIISLFSFVFCLFFFFVFAYVCCVCACAFFQKNKKTTKKTMVLKKKTHTHTHTNTHKKSRAKKKTTYQFFGVLALIALHM